MALINWRVPARLRGKFVLLKPFWMRVKGFIRPVLAHLLHAAQPPKPLASSDGQAAVDEQCGHGGGSERECAEP